MILHDILCDEEGCVVRFTGPLNHTSEQVVDLALSGGWALH